MTAPSFRNWLTAEASKQPPTTFNQGLGVTLSAAALVHRLASKLTEDWESPDDLHCLLHGSTPLGDMACDALEDVRRPYDALVREFGPPLRPVPTAVEPNACGPCRSNAQNGRPAEHPECVQRATLLPAPDAPGYEEIGEMTDGQRAALPARFHTPVWEGNATPNAWLCAVCWGDGWVTRWPCETASKRGAEVFTPEHHAELARDRLAAELGRVRAELATARKQLDALALVKVWRNEDGREFLFADDVRAALGLPTPAAAVPSA